MIDSLSAFRKYDYTLARKIVNEGRALIIVVNKWDLFDENFRKKALRYLKYQT